MMYTEAQSAYTAEPSSRAGCQGQGYDQVTVLKWDFEGTLSINAESKNGKGFQNSYCLTQMRVKYTVHKNILYLDEFNH